MVITLKFILKIFKLANVEEVIVNIKEVLLKVNASDNGGSEISLAQDLGPVDLMKLHSGHTFALADVNLPVGTKVNQIRLVVEESGNYINYADGSVCSLQTPSQQQSGLKVINPEFEVEEGQAYSLVVDFNSKKSLVFKGNGGCLLKPVLKWGGVTSTPLDDVSGDGDTIGEEEDPVVEDPVVEDPTPSEPNMDMCFNVDFDLFDTSTWPADFVYEDYAHCY